MQFVTRAAVSLALLPILLASPASADTSPCPALSQAKTVQVTETVSYRRQALGLQPVVNYHVKMVIPQPGKATLATLTPISMRIEARPITRIGAAYQIAHPPHPSMLVTDGKTKWEYYRPGDVFRHDAINPKKFYGSAWQSQWNFTMPTLVLFSGNSHISGPFSWFKPAGKTLLDGKPMRLYQYMNTNKMGEVSFNKLWVDAATSMPYRYSFFYADKGKPLTENERFDYRQWALNKPISTAQFSWVPPPAAKLYVAPIQKPLLVDDSVAPDFTVQGKDGKTIHLSDYKGKTVVLDFWATWCGPCQVGMRHTLSVASKYAPQGVVFLAVNVWDKKTEFDKWLPLHPEYARFSFAIDPHAFPNDVASQYQVTGIPTQFVIDKDGRIVSGLNGFGGLDLELAIQAATGERNRDVYREERASTKKMMEDMQ